MGVRITHLPTGLSAESRVHRSQGQNRRDAFDKLSKALVVRVRNSLQESDPGNSKLPTEVIRTYHQAANRVTDHRTGKQATWDEILEKGRLDKLD